MTLEPNRPSSFARVIACPGSRRMLASAKTIDDTSIYAETGTAAHELASRCLTEGLTPIEFYGSIIYDSPKFGAIIVDAQMVRAVSIYVSLVRDRFAEADLHGVELRVDIPDLDMPRGGTIDAWSYHRSGVLTCFDYKNGAGVEVPLASMLPEDADGLVWPDPLTLNPQVGAYLWGKLRELEGRDIPVGAVEVVEGVVVQPNAQSWKGKPKEVRLTRDEFFRWVREVAFPAVAASRAPDAPLRAGDHCRKTFCPVRGMCPAVLTDAAAELAAALSAPRPPAGTQIFAPYSET